MLFIFFKRQADGVDTVTHPGRFRSVGEDVPEVGIAFCTSDFDTCHTETAVFDLAERLGAVRFEEAWPSRTGIVLCIGSEQRSVAADAVIDPVTFEIIVFAAERCLCSVLSADLKGFRRELRPPLFFRFDDFFH